MNKTLQKLEDNNAKLVVLTPEIAEKASETLTKNDAKFPVLLDENLKLAKEYGLVFKLDDAIIPVYRDMLKMAESNGNDSMELPMTATYVIDTQGVITYAFIDADYTQRADPGEVADAVMALTKK